MSPVISKMNRLQTAVYRMSIRKVCTSDYVQNYYRLHKSLLQVDYIKMQSNPQDGKLFAIGHSMGGILLYAALSLCGMPTFFRVLWLISPMS